MSIVSVKTQISKNPIYGAVLEFCPGYVENNTIIINMTSTAWKWLPKNEFSDTIIEIICHEEIELFSYIEEPGFHAHSMVVKIMSYIERNITALSRLVESDIISKAFTAIMMGKKIEKYQIIKGHFTVDFTDGTKIDVELWKE